MPIAHFAIESLYNVHSVSVILAIAIYETTLLKIADLNPVTSPW